jgi:hypothetical protein
MSFWDTKNGTPVDGSVKHAFGSGFAPIPDGTTAPAIITKFELKEFDNHETGRPDRCYQITWRLIGGEFSKRQVWQKIYAFSPDAEKHAKALNMMKRIFVLANFEMSHDMAPTTEDLYPLINKQMGIKIGFYKEKNSVREVHALDNNFEIATGKPIEVTFTKNTNNNDFEQPFVPSQHEPNSSQFVDDIPY